MLGDLTTHRYNPPPKPATLAEMITAMQAWATCGDYEVAHAEADDLLEAAVCWLANHRPQPEQVTQLLTAYHAVGKWYA